MPSLYTPFYEDEEPYLPADLPTDLPDTTGGYKPRTSAFDALNAHQAAQPTLDGYKPSKARRIGGMIAAGLAGFGEGYLNSGPSGRLVRPGVGQQLGQGIIYGPYMNARRDWEDRAGKLSEAAKLEQQQNRTDAETQLYNSRMETEKARQGVWRTRQAQLEKPEAPKPIEPPKSEEEMLVRVLSDPHSTEEQKAAAQRRLDERRRPPAPGRPTHEQVIQDRTKTADAMGLKGEARNYYILNGRIPVERERSSGGGRGGSQGEKPMTSKEKAALESKKNARLIALGRRARAVIADPTEDRQALEGIADEAQAVQEDYENTISTRTGGAVEPFDMRGHFLSKYAGADAPKAAEAAKAGTSAKPRQPDLPRQADLPPQAVAQLKEGVVTTFRNGQKWTLKNGKPSKVG